MVSHRPSNSSFELWGSKFQCSSDFLCYLHIFSGKFSGRKSSKMTNIMVLIIVEFVSIRIMNYLFALFHK